MVGSSLISCCNFLTSLMLTTQEILVECKLMTCLPKAFPVFSPFSFSSHCLYSAYVLLIVSSLALSSFSCVHLLPNKYALPLLMTLFKHSRFLCSQCLLLVYQRYLQKIHHRLICFQHQPLCSLMNVGILK